ncbi:hypothetical protein M8C21_015420, partial [Ambrosia artemisiifolia]
MVEEVSTVDDVMTNSEDLDWADGGVCILLLEVVHPIHDLTFYLTVNHKKRLKEELGVEPWTVVQKLGDTVFIPAGCANQVRNLKILVQTKSGIGRMIMPLLNYSLTDYELWRSIIVRWQTLLQCQTVVHLQTLLLLKTPIRDKKFRIWLKGTKPTLGQNTNHHWMRK